MKKLNTLLLIALLLIVGCSSSRKMVEPTGCKPEKEKEYKMIEPTIHKNQKKFMISKPKTQYDYDKRKEFEKTGK